MPRLLPLGVPQDLVNGRDDRIIPARLATDYVAKATGAGDAATLHTDTGDRPCRTVAPEMRGMGGNEAPDPRGLLDAEGHRR